ncbi:hypothetical protein ACMD2_26452 [Ananas comosus]|uniref:AB hydrolase-1 domain-containing protein n=1 Tax=Ananas comosus TaxID=4615 RepID=A0A199VDP6_ANACO|nr:hypothetical protein ACMD2_26452 [Ananas comosus]
MARSSLKPSSLRSRPLLSSSPLFPARSPSSPLHHDSRSSETLAYGVIQPSDQRFDATALVLHGLLGSGRNWRTFARNLASELSKRSPSDEWRMVLADLRNHGRSAGIRGLEPPHDMVNAARDLANLVKSHDWNWPDVVIGHSMGGKVALEFAASCARGDYGESAILPKQLWVLDSVPGEVNSEDSDGEVEKVVVDHMLSLGFSKSTHEWIGSNLKKEGERVTWSFDLHAAIEMFQSYRYWSLLEHLPKGLEIAIVRRKQR